MFILSFKVNKNKLILGLVIILIIGALVCVGYKMLAKRGEWTHQVPVITINQVESEMAIKFIEGFGNKVDTGSVCVEEFKIPEEFDTLYKRYNQYQIDVGLDLTPYRGKNVRRYTYKVLNYKVPAGYEGQQVYADAIVYNGKVIAGDLKTNQINGFMVSLRGKTFKEITGIEEWMYK